MLNMITGGSRNFSATKIVLTNQKQFELETPNFIEEFKNRDDNNIEFKVPKSEKNFGIFIYGL